MKIRKILDLVLIISFSCFFVVASSFIVFANDMPLIKSDFKNKVQEVILKNPEIIIEAIEKYNLNNEEKLIRQRKNTLNQLLLNTEKLLGKSPRKGANSQEIFLIEFSDFQCPFCSQVQPILETFVTNHRNELTFVYKHLPLTSIHPEAMNAAKASWAASKQNKFWEYHDKLFENQENLGEELYLQIAQSLNLNLKRFKKDVELATEEIIKDIQLASSLNITSTPFFIFKDKFINGTVSLENLEKLLKEIKESASIDR